MRGRRLLRVSLLLALLVGLFLAGLPAVSAQQPGGRICVLAFRDANSNGLRDPIEPLEPDVVVSLQTEQAVVIGNYVTTGQTEPYCFTGLGPGNYTVNFMGGMVEPTGPSLFRVTIVDDQSLAQVQYGAVPVDAALTATAAGSATTSGGETDNNLLRIAFALGGAGLLMVLFAALGVIIYWIRYRS